MANAAILLSDFFQAHFEVDSLRAFLDRRVHAAIPGGNVGLAQLAHDGAGALERRGFIDAELFQELLDLAERSQRYRDAVAQLAEKCGVQVPEMVPVVAPIAATPAPVGSATILFLASTPMDVASINVTHEYRQIEKAIADSPRRDRVVLKTAWAAQIADLPRKLQENHPRFVHVSSHGDGAGLFVSADDNERAVSVSVEDLTSLFELYQEDITCCIFNVCHSKNLAESVAKHIAFTVGYDGTADDVVAVDFAAAFYEALLADASFEKAYRLAFWKVKAKKIPGYDRLCCFSRPGTDPGTLKLF